MKTNTAPVPALPIAAMAYEIDLVTGDDGEVIVPDRIRVLPDGEFSGVDGRPKGMMTGNGESRRSVKCKAWRLDAAIAAHIIQVFEENGLDLVIDYDHQTLYSKENGQPAIAAGWIKSLEYEAGRGMWAAVEWTELGAQRVAKKEYRYVSPVFPFDPDTGAIDSLHSVALTNTPCLNQLGEIAAAASRLLSINSAPSGSPTTTDEESTDMELKTICVALGISPETSETSVLTALSAQTGRIKSLETECNELRGKVFDPAKHIPLDEHQKVVTELTALKAEQDKAAHEQLLMAALSDGRILQPNADYWKQQPLAALQAFLQTAKPIAALTATQTGGQAPAGGGGGGAPSLTADELAVCKSMGISAEEFVKHRDAA